ncbi:hypothetical protein [Streptomyces althioticus]|uniref:hypothetical protein n=1 Tax=Streptomyces althioticus TaxID=83380 RepID=UPI0033F918E0
MRSRDERIEEYYHNGTRELAEWLVDIEDQNQELKKLQELDPSRLESALRMYIAELDYDIHKNLENGEEDGLDHYSEEVDYFLRCWETAGEG